MKYTAAYFRNSFPNWKKKKDSVLVRIFFRPLSFFLASFFANMGFSANDVSYFSTVIAVIGAGFFLVNQKWAFIIGALIMIFWMLLDCTDGNIARSVGKQPYGEFADASSSYIFINFLFFALGIAAYRNNGLFFSAGLWQLLVLGNFAGSADSLARLLYQKFLNSNPVSNGADDGEKNIVDRSQSRLVKIHDRIDKEVGQNGLFLPFLLICSAFEWFDLFVLFYFFFYAFTLVGSYCMLIKKSKG